MAPLYLTKEDITNLPSFKIAKLGIGLVPEGRQIFPNLTTHENLIATANITEKENLTWTLERVYELFPDLKSRAKFMGNLLSGR
jgi:branched-chain amino acid transport system ATP-binding protein